MNPILKEAFAKGIQRYYPLNGAKLVVSIYKSFVLYYIDNAPNSTNLSFIETSKDGLKYFEYQGTQVLLCLSLPYNVK